MRTSRWLDHPTVVVGVCLLAAAVANVAVPRLHALVHGLEAFAAAFAVLLVSRLSHRLERREDELRRMHERAARTERTASLTALAAGAAHELATPLGTIAVAARELERGHGDVHDDAALIRAQVERCRLLLEEMTGGRGAVSERVTVAVLVDDVSARLTPLLRARLVVRLEADAPAMFAPRAVLAQAVAGLVKNGVEAGGDTPVVLGIGGSDGRVHVAVRDDGRGMDDAVLAHVGEPFFSTRGDVGGRGLGVFLARQVTEGLGGTFHIESSLGQGTRVLLDVPAVA